MDYIWLFMLTGSLLILCLILLKVRLRWIGYTLTNMILAAIILYGINFTGVFGEYQIPLNLVTVATIGLLGIPGAVLLITLKVVLI
jgi:inhibitor of the pro-sigma K processing machinery